MRDLSKTAYNVADLRDLAQRKLPKGLFDFVDRGTEDEVALRNNRAAFERIKLKQRMLVDVSRRSLETTLFGKAQALPVAVAPTGPAGLMWFEGEIALARAAAKAKVPFSLATTSTTALERVAGEAGGTLWFQLYMWAERSLSYRLVERAKAAGFEALIVTVDGPVAANREHNLRNGFSLPFSFNRRNVADVLRHPSWLFGVFLRYLMTTGTPRFENFPPELQHKVTAAPMARKSLTTDTLAWDDLRALRKLWSGPLIVKGILDTRDAKLAVDCGADGIVVSNHGGRNLDRSRAPIDALPEIVDAVSGRVVVGVDSGFRRGSDVVTALALGAKFVMLGRPTLYATAAAGEAGAARMFHIFREEIDRVMALMGCTRIADLSRECCSLE